MSTIAPDKRACIDFPGRPKLRGTEYSLDRDRRTPTRSHRHHCVEHGVWDHTRERAPAWHAPLVSSAYLPTRMVPATLPRHN